jgi:hypothetical protein
MGESITYMINATLKRKRLAQINGKSAICEPSGRVRVKQPSVCTCAGIITSCSFNSNEKNKGVPQ